MHCQVKSLLTEPPYFLITLRLFDIFISNNTHRLLVASVTSCRYRAQNNGRFDRSKSVQNEELTGQTSNVAFMFAFMFTFKTRKKKIETLIQIIALLYGEKLSEVKGSPSQPSQFYRASVQQKKLPRLTESTAGCLSPEFTQTLIDSTIADVQHNFVSLSQTPILAPFSSSITTLAHAK